MGSRLAPDGAHGISPGCQSGGVCGDMFGGLFFRVRLSVLVTGLFQPSRKIKILSVLPAGSLKSVRVRVPLGLSCGEQT